MKYQNAFNIWEVPSVLLVHVQPGQHVYAGDKATKGVFLGVKKSGSIVVAWHDNAIRHDYKEYIKSLRYYAKGK